MELANQIRAYAFLASVLENQQHDPFCRICKARVNSAVKTREGLAEFEKGLPEEPNALPSELRPMLADAKRTLEGLFLPENAAGQKKAGNCKLPEGVCFVKVSLAILQKV